MLNFRFKKYITLILLFVLFLVIYIGLKKEQIFAEVSFLDVGQGDATLISLPGEIQILIDGGPSSGKIISSLSNYIPFYDKQIELIILTHPHADHLRGFNAVLKNYRVKNIILSGAYYESETYKEFIELIENEGAEIYIVQEGDRVIWNNREIIKILSPQESALGKEFRKIHDSTIVAELEIGGIKFLFAGDMENNLEMKLIERDLIKDVDVLKVGHHGSKTSSSANFLNTALAEVSVIQVGNNSYGHPDIGVLERFKNLGSKILRTDELGDIVWSFRIN